MSVSVTMTFASIDAAVAFLAGKPQQPAAVTVSAPAAPAPSKPTAAPTPAPTAVQSAAPAPAAELTYETILAALQAKAKKVSSADFRAKLTEWGISKVPELKTRADLYADVAAYCAG